MNKLLLLERNTAKPAFEALPSEKDVRMRMRNRGIPTELGKNTSHHYVDLVAWGCVVLDVKESAGDSRGYFKFRLRSNRKAKYIRAHLFVFVCDYGSHKTYHVFPNNHETFMHTDGNMKRCVTFNPKKSGHATRTKDFGKSLTPALMRLHQDAWYYVETERLALAKQLIAQGATALSKDAA